MHWVPLKFKSAMNDSMIQHRFYWFTAQINKMRKGKGKKTNMLYLPVA